MENDEPQVQEEEVVQEEVTSTEEVETEELSDDTITLKKSDFTKLNRKAKAYDATKGKQQTKLETKEAPDYISTVFMVKDLNGEEYETLRGEADDLGISFEKYLSSESGKTLLSKVRQDKKSKDASEALTSKSPVYQKYTQQDLKAMTSKELEKVLPKE
jgi:hypothetical protein